jgi:hypothetical protein
LATVIAILTTMVVANATQTITTPNAAFISYNLAAGASSAPITPATNRSVLVMGCCTTAGFLGQATLLHIPSHGMVWAGYDWLHGAVVVGSSGTAGTRIVNLDGQSLDIQVASADTIRIHNGGTTAGTLAGNVTLIW